MVGSDTQALAAAGVGGEGGGVGMGMPGLGPGGIPLSGMAVLPLQTHYNNGSRR
jgi:hypothetical protein